MVLKFAAEHSQQRPPCPDPARFVARERTLYRFTRNPAKQEHFEPNLDRVNGKIKCIHYALSMWATEEQAQERYNSLASLNDDGGKTAAKEYGDHISEIDIVESDGLMDLPTREGHVRLHPAAGVAFASRVSRYLRCEYLERADPVYYTTNVDERPADGQAVRS